MRVVYDGPFPAVEVPDLGYVVECGVPVDVPDEVGASLIAQDPWSEVLSDEQAERRRIAVEQEAERLAAEEAERLAAESNGTGEPPADPPTTPKPTKPARTSKENA